MHVHDIHTSCLQQLWCRHRCASSCQSVLLGSSPGVQAAPVHRWMTKCGRRIGRCRGMRPGEADLLRRRDYTSGRETRRIRYRRRGQQAHRPHHVILFMRQEVAMPDVFPTEVSQRIDDLRYRCYAGRRRYGKEVRVDILRGSSRPEAGCCSVPGTGAPSSSVLSPR